MATAKKNSTSTASIKKHAEKAEKPLSAPSAESSSGEATPSHSATKPRIPAGVPMIYADQAMDIVYGLHTSKVVLGEETGSGVRDIRPVGVVVIPTATLLGMALGVVRDLSSAGMLKETAERYAGILTFMRDGLSADLSPQTQSESE